MCTIRSEILTPIQAAAINAAIRGEADAHIVLTYEQVIAMVRAVEAML